MWPFTKSANSADRSLERLHDRVDTVERQVRSMLLEWESTYNKLRAVVARLNKRDERAAEKDATPAAPGEAFSVNNHSGSQLTAGRVPRIPRRNY